MGPRLKISSPHMFEMLWRALSLLKRDAHRGDICYLFKLCTVIVIYTPCLKVLSLHSNPCNKWSLIKQTFVSQRVRRVHVAQWTGTWCGIWLEPIELDCAPVRAEARGQWASPVSALLQLCRVILPARPDSFGYVHPGRNCHCPVGVITDPSKCLFSKKKKK